MLLWSLTFLLIVTFLCIHISNGACYYLYIINFRCGRETLIDNNKSALILILLFVIITPAKDRVHHHNL